MNTLQPVLLLLEIFFVVSPSSGFLQAGNPELARDDAFAWVRGAALPDSGREIIPRNRMATTAEGVAAVHDWLLVASLAGEQRIKLGSSENRKKTPEQMMAIRTGACGELCSMYIKLLQDTGIKARHCVLSYKYGFKYGKGGRHYYVEYWDKELKQWTAVDASVERSLDIDTPKSLFASGAWNALACYAYPDQTDRRDLYHTDGWDACINVTANVCPVYPLKLACAGSAKTAGVAQVLVWNDSTWRCTILSPWAASADTAEVTLADTKPTSHPALFTAVRDGELWWSLQQPSSSLREIKLMKAEPEVCIQWNAE